MRSVWRLAAGLGLGLLVGVPALAGPEAQPQVEFTTTPNATMVGSDTPTDKDLIGLLAIIATVCVVGISVGAIRAIVGQRASRAEFA